MHLGLKEWLLLLILLLWLTYVHENTTYLPDPWILPDSSVTNSFLVIQKVTHYALYSSAGAKAQQQMAPKGHTVVCILKIKKLNFSLKKGDYTNNHWMESEPYKGTLKVLIKIKTCLHNVNIKFWKKKE